MLRLGIHKITRYVFDADDNATFGIDSNRAKVLTLARDDFRAIMALNSVNTALTGLGWLRSVGGIELTEHSAVMSQLEAWKYDLDIQVNEIKSQLDLD